MSMMTNNANPKHSGRCQVQTVGAKDKAGWASCTRFRVLVLYFPLGNVQIHGIPSNHNSVTKVTIGDDDTESIPKNSLATGVLDVDDEQDSLVNAVG